MWLSLDSSAWSDAKFEVALLTLQNNLGFSQGGSGSISEDPSVLIKAQGSSKNTSSIVRMKSIIAISIRLQDNHISPTCVLADVILYQKYEPTNSGEIGL